MLSVDVDRLESVNDRWGHAIGDQVLVAVADRIAEAVRPSEVVARFAAMSSPGPPGPLLSGRCSGDGPGS